jgi:DNA-binding transcriptional LysR family regulator
MLDGMRTFLAVAEAGRFSTVAKARGVAVSSVSRKLDALEVELGAKLLHRSSRVMVLTEAGERLLPRARSLVAELDDARDELLALHAEPRGLLRVTAPASFGRRHVLPAVASFLSRYPLIELELDLGDRWVDLAAQRVDVAVRIGVLPDSDLVATRLAPLRRLVCASPAYLSKHGRPANPRGLLAHNCLTVAATRVPTGWWSFAGVNRGAPLPVRGTLRTDDTEALLQAAAQGLGIVHLASWLVGELLAAGQLVSLFPDEVTQPSKAPGAIHAVRMPGRSGAAKAQVFIAHLKASFGEPPSWEAAPRRRAR